MRACSINNLLDRKDRKPPCFSSRSSATAVKEEGDHHETDRSGRHGTDLCRNDGIGTDHQLQPGTALHTALNHLTVVEMGEPVTSFAVANPDAFSDPASRRQGLSEAGERKGVDQSVYLDCDPAVEL